jgi:hypothetical protein
MATLSSPWAGKRVASECALCLYGKSELADKQAFPHMDKQAFPHMDKQAFPHMEESDH